MASCPESIAPAGIEITLTGWVPRPCGGNQSHLLVLKYGQGQYLWEPSGQGNQSHLLVLKCERALVEQAQGRESIAPAGIEMSDSAIPSPSFQRNQSHLLVLK